MRIAQTGSLAIDRRYVAGLLLLLPVIVFLFWLGSHPVAGLTGDGGPYLMLARSYAGGFSGDGLLRLFVTREIYFPPGYPLLLSLAGGGTDIQLAHQITNLTLGLALVLFFFWAAGELRSALWAVGIALLFGLLSPVLSIASDLWSEFPYLAASLGVLLAFRHYERSGDPAALFLTALLVAATCLFRATGFAMVAALALLLLRRAPRAPSTWGAIAIAAGVPAIWSLTHGTAVQAYSRYMDFSALASLVGANLEAIGSYWMSALAPLGWGSVLLAGMAAGGLLMRLRAGKLDALYVLIYFGIILLWPFATWQYRFLVPVWPFAITYMFVPLIFLTRAGPSWPRRAGHLLLGLLLIPAAFSVVELYGRLTAPLPPELEPFRKSPDWVTPAWLYRADIPERLGNLRSDRAMIIGSEAVRQHVPPNQCVWSPRFHTVLVYGGRLSVPFPNPEDLNPAYMLTKCRYALVLSEPMAEYAADYPIQALRTMGFEDVAVLSLPASEGVPQSTVTLLRHPSATGH